MTRFPILNNQLHCVVISSGAVAGTGIRYIYSHTWEKGDRNHTVGQKVDWTETTLGSVLSAVAQPCTLLPGKDRRAVREKQAISIFYLLVLNEAN